MLEHESNLKIIFLFLLLLLIPITNFVFGDETITLSETKWNNQTITNVYVTVENNGNSVNNSIMISSGMIIGFVGFSSIFQFRNYEFSEDQKKVVYIIGIIIASIATLHLFTILFVYHNLLDIILEGYYYTLTIGVTIGGFGFLIALTLIQIDWNKSVESGKHEMFADYQIMLNSIEEAQKQFTQTMDSVLDKSNKQSINDKKTAV